MMLQLDTGATLNGGTFYLYRINRPHPRDCYYLLEIWRKKKVGKTRSNLQAVKPYTSIKYAMEKVNQLRGKCNAVNHPIHNNA